MSKYKVLPILSTFWASLIIEPSSEISGTTANTAGLPLGGAGSSMDALLTLLKGGLLASLW